MLLKSSIFVAVSSLLASTTVTNATPIALAKGDQTSSELFTTLPTARPTVMPCPMMNGTNSTTGPGPDRPVPGRAMFRRHKLPAGDAGQPSNGTAAAGGKPVKGKGKQKGKGKKPAAAARRDEPTPVLSRYVRVRW